MESLETYMAFENSYKERYLQNSEDLSKNPSVKEILQAVQFDVDVVLSALSISPNKLGYSYWKDAVYLFITYDKQSVKICSEIYSVIAVKYKKTSISVERAMRLCFENAMYYISKTEPNFITTFMKKYLLYPKNNQLLIKIVELISMRRFQKEKRKIILIDEC